MFYSSQSGGNKTTKFITTRLGSVLDPNCFVVQFNRQIANGGPVTITHPESVRYFMNTKEACQLILKQLPWAMEGGLHIRYG
jgi:FlaA1/EpsC-like NDP-sugar epimerase